MAVQTKQDGTYLADEGLKEFLRRRTRRKPKDPPTLDTGGSKKCTNNDEDKDDKTVDTSVVVFPCTHSRMLKKRNG